MHGKAKGPCFGAGAAKGWRREAGWHVGWLGSAGKDAAGTEDSIAFCFAKD